MSILYKNITRVFISIFLMLFVCTTINAKIADNLEYQEPLFQRCINLNPVDYGNEVTILRPGDFLYVGDALSESWTPFSIYFKYVRIVNPYSPLQTPNSEPFNLEFRYCFIQRDNPLAQMECASPISPLYNIYLTEDFVGNYPEYSYNLDSYGGWGSSMSMGFCGVLENTLFIKTSGSWLKKNFNSKKINLKKLPILNKDL